MALQEVVSRRGGIVTYRGFEILGNRFFKKQCKKNVVGEFIHLSPEIKAINH